MTSFGQKPFGQKTFGQKTFGQKTFGQKTFGQKTFGQKTFGKHNIKETHQPMNCRVNQMTCQMICQINIVFAKCVLAE